MTQSGAQSLGCFCSLGKVRLPARAGIAGFALALMLVAAPGLAAPAIAAVSYSQMVARIDRDCAKSPLIRVAALGKAASGKRTVWMVRLAAPSVDAPRRVMILCRQHGDEPASTEAALGFLDDVADGKSPQIVKDLSRESIYIVPMVNPDGADAFTRDNANGADLNRDWGVFREPETRAVYAAFQAIRPQALLDMHSWDEGDPFRGFCLEAPRDGVACDPDLAQAARALQQRGAQAVYAQSGQAIAVTNYGAAADPDLCHRFFLLRGDTVALLFETQPDSGPDPLPWHVNVARATITWLVGDMAAQPSWGQVAQREAYDWKRTRLAAAVFARPEPASAKPVFLAAAVEPAPPPSPLADAVRAVGTTARRIPDAVWWALAIYALLALARPIIAPGQRRQEEIPARRHRTWRAERGSRGRSSWDA